MFNAKIRLGIVFYFVVISTVSIAKVAVQYGNSDDLDACATIATVSGLSNGSDGFLAVKDSPNIKAKRIDKIFNGQTVWICESSKDGNWLGVVYDSTGKKECGVTSPIEKRVPYKGPCNSGWVSKKYVKILGG